MFLRKKRNHSGSVSVQIIDKSQGYRMVKTVGCARHPEEIERLWQQGKQIINHVSKGQQQLFSMKSEPEMVVENFVRELSNASIQTVGPELIFGTLFDRLGFNVVGDEMFRHLVLARLSHPVSKLKTVDYLRRYQGVTVSVQAIYRFLDKLSSKYKDKVERIAYEYSRRILKTIVVVFYDLTTLYFEAEDEDDLRKIGFSKDGKFRKPQIMLGLLVGEGGYPIGYDIFEGNTFEGHTLVPTLETVQKKYDLDKPIVVADAALLSKDNLQALDEAGYQFIVGARIRNESQTIKDSILKKAVGKEHGDRFQLTKPDSNRLIISYSDKRAKKDAYNRQRGISKLNQRVKSGKLTKENINNRGYNKFLNLEGEVKVTIDQDKIEADKQWDGLKGYITNSRLHAQKIIQNYTQLWQIEKAFRISKTDLRIRPIYHYRRRRIEAHICIAFVAYTLYKELERLLEKRDIRMSAQRAAELTQNMYRLEYTLPSSQEQKQTILRMDPQQKILYELIHN